ncbi:MAG: response regulator [Candidatus Omnitrophica bacterium]|nr:response regulator [Candidatus Omnitrophota bacterium]
MSQPVRILLVDDEPSILKMVGKRLEVSGYAVSVAMDGQEALEKVTVERPDLVILDLMLPKLNGYSVCSTLKQDPALKSIPVILFSAKALDRDVQQGMACGADAYICKPFKAQELLEQIQLLLKARISEGG